MRTTTHHLRFTNGLAATAACALLALGLNACGADSSATASDSDPSRLTSDQATAALLSDDNLGDDYVRATDDDQDEKSDLGCLDALEDIDSDDAPVSEEREFEASNDFGLPAVSSGVSSFDKVADASDRFATALDALDGCTSVEVTDEDGATITLEVSVDSEKSSSQAAEQFNIAATGSISAEGMDFDFGLWASAVRIDNHVTFTAYTDLETDAGAASIEAYTAAAVDRLVAVLDEEAPSEDRVAVAQIEGDETDGEEEPEAGGFEEFALDGGTHT